MEEKERIREGSSILQHYNSVHKASIFLAMLQGGALYWADRQYNRAMQIAELYRLLHAHDLPCFSPPSPLPPTLIILSYCFQIAWEAGQNLHLIHFTYTITVT